MTDGEALLRMIETTPDDDAPRLVYADWLDEQGDAERAEFIRLECALARQTTWDQTRRVDEDRALHLWRTHARRWLGPFARCAGQWDYSRGFPEHLTWLDDARSLQAFLDRFADYDPLLGSATIPPGVFLRSLIFNRPSPELAEVVARWSGGYRLRRLKFIGLSSLPTGIGDRGMFALTWASSSLVNLDELHLEFNALSPDAIRSLIEAPNLHSIRCLNLCGNEILPHALLLLAQDQTWSNLRSLDLYATQALIGLNTITLNGPGMQNLTYLNIGGNAAQSTWFREHVAEALATSTMVQKLKYLECSSNRVGNDSIRWLAQAAWQRLEYLELAHNEITDEGAMALVEAPYLGQLRRLNLRGNPISEAAILALAKRFSRAVLRV